MHVALNNEPTVIATILYFVKGAPEIIIDRTPLLRMIPTGYPLEYREVGRIRKLTNDRSKLNFTI